MVVREPEQHFIQAPVGVHAAVCVDEIDMGEVANHFDPEKGPVPTVRLVWQIAEDMPDGKPYLIKKDYRASLHEKAGLRKDLEAWRGRAFTPVELSGFDLEDVIGATCQLNVVAKTSQKGKTYSNIAAIMPLAKGMLKMVPRDYVRQKDRPQPVAAPKPPTSEPPPNSFDGIDDSDVPF
jgi:hypothetical protein